MIRLAGTGVGPLMVRTGENGGYNGRGASHSRTYGLVETIG
jgi:hypothetical protein